MHVNGAQRARWDVLYRHPNAARAQRQGVKRKSFGTDFAAALQFYTQALPKAADVTLRCCNMGHPPPERFREKSIAVARKGARTVRLKDDQKAPKGWQAGTVVIQPMRKVNARGLFWCPSCIKFREFEARKGFEQEGIWIDNKHIACPTCGITHRDHNVRKYNPKAQEIRVREER